MSHRFCDGLPRRDFLRLGTATAFGLGLNAANILRAAAAAGPASRTRDVSIIYLYLKGGLSTIDTFDMKPDAPARWSGRD